MLLAPKDVGILVEHTVWQRGKVLDVSPPYAIVHFTSLVDTPEGPQRKLREDTPQISKSPVQTDPILDLVGIGLGKPKKSAAARAKAAKAKALVHHLDESIAWFEKHYPGKFADEKFVDADLRNKRAAHEVFVANFGNGKGQALIDAGKIDEIADGLDKLWQATNIPSTFEVKAAHKGLKNLDAAAHLLAGVLEFIADGTKPSSFAKLAEGVAQLPADGGKVLTWPNVTLLPFLADPGKFMVLKPASTESMAARMNFDLRYQTVPNWSTYEALQRMGTFLLQRLQLLGAKDLIDVQAFMWVTKDLD
ncbi:MAG: hypothetical protein ABI665_20230 [Vicinamibacterales bacterium]